MDVKISVTTKCNAQCKTCPVWKYPGEDMTLGNFKMIYDKLCESNRVNKIFLNNTGDLYNHPDHIEILKHVEKNKARKNAYLTTNGALMDYVPDVEMIVISFNGGNKEAYEYTTGLDFDQVKKNIEAHYEELKKIKHLEMHCLVWKDTQGTEKEILRTFWDFPGHIRLSYKYDNQHEEDKTLDSYKKEQRVPCDYLDKINIWPDGSVILCAHDFKAEEIIGNILTQSVDEVIADARRIKKQQEHDNHKYLGLCKDCNYNVMCDGSIKYIKGRI